MRKLLLGLILLSSLAACEFQAESNSYKPTTYYVKPGEELVECVNKYDSKDRIRYYVSQATEYHPENIPVKYIKYIKTVEGKMVSINESEAENYTCQSFSAP